MHNATDHLRAEHADLRRALAVLARIAAVVETTAAFPAEDCVVVLRFLRDFVVGVHFRKESDHVVPALAMHGDDRDAENAGNMLRLQEEVVALVHSLVLFWEPAGELTAAERQGFAEAATTLCSRCERLLLLEEDLLFPRAERCVPADDRLGWMEAFAELDRSRGGLQDWRPRLAALAARWR